MNKKKITSVPPLILDYIGETGVSYCPDLYGMRSLFYNLKAYNNEYDDKDMPDVSLN